MRIVLFYLYLTLINLIWIFGFLAALASGHELSFNNTYIQKLSALTLPIIIMTFILFQYFERKKNGYRFATMLSLVFMSILSIYFIYELIQVGLDTYLINIPFYLVLIFLFLYSCRLFFKQTDPIKNNY